MNLSIFRIGYSNNHNKERLNRPNTTLVLLVPRGNLLLPRVTSQLVLVQHALGKKAVVGEETRLMVVLVEVAVLSLHGVRGEEHGGVGRTIDLVA